MKDLTAPELDHGLRIMIIEIHTATTARKTHVGKRLAGSCIQDTNVQGECNSAVNLGQRHSIPYNRSHYGWLSVTSVRIGYMEID